MNYYQILRVGSNATQAGIKSAYRKLAAEKHPDKGGKTAEFDLIARAYEVLSDPVSRRQYDEQQSTAPIENLHEEVRKIVGQYFKQFETTATNPPTQHHEDQ